MVLQRVWKICSKPWITLPLCPTINQSGKVSSSWVSWVIDVWRGEIFVKKLMIIHSPLLYEEWTWKHTRALLDKFASYHIKDNHLIASRDVYARWSPGNRNESKTEWTRRKILPHFFISEGHFSIFILWMQVSEADRDSAFSSTIHNLSMPRKLYIPGAFHGVLRGEKNKILRNYIKQIETLH